MPKRRGRGEGSIYQRASDGRWCASGIVEIDGVKTRKTRYGATKKEALEKLHTLQRAAADGKLAGSDREQVAAYLDRWLPTRRLRPVTIEAYRSVIENQIKPVLGRIELRKLRSTHIQQMLDGMATDGKYRSTIRHVRAVLSAALQPLIEDDVIAKRVLSKTEIPHARESQSVTIDMDIIARILDVTADSSIAPIVTTAIMSGLRRSELLALRWEDVNLDTGHISVRRSLTRTKGHYHILAPKTRASARTIPIPTELVTTLREHHVAQMEARLRLGPAWEENNLVFPNMYGRIYNPDVLLDRFHARMLRDPALEHITFHKCRKAYAIILLAMGTDIKSAQELMGHEDAKTTLNIYAQAFERNKREAVQNLGDAIRTHRKQA